MMNLPISERDLLPGIQDCGVAIVVATSRSPRSLRDTWLSWASMGLAASARGFYLVA